MKVHKTKPTPSEVTTVGIDVCSTCHDRIFPDWMMGAHGNLESPDEATHAALASILDSAGFPSYALFTDTTCATCHDPLGDGRRLESGFDGNVPRPVIGCESCHGGGSLHYGVGELPFPHPGPLQCGQCHNQNFPASHLPDHPMAANILEDYLSSPHARSINSHNLVDPNDLTTVRSTCSRCHTDEGFKEFVNAVPGTDGHDTIANYFTNVPPVTDANPVQCRTCHNPHTTNDGNFTAIQASDIITQSSQFNTCTACHQLINSQGTVLAGNTAIYDGSTLLNGDSFAYHDPRANSHGSFDEIITPNHAAVPGDIRLNTGPDAVAVYYVKKGDDDSCIVCHNPHSADVTINKQYSRSGHGDATADPWTHYDWKAKTGGTDKLGRQACQRCHTSTGFKNYANALSDGTVYNPTQNDFSYLLGIDDPNTEIDTNDQLETLYCWGCHAVTSGPSKGDVSFKGDLRNPGRIPLMPSSVIGSAAYPADDRRGDILPLSPFVIAQSGDTLYPDLNGSNVCLACHSGRESGGSIRNADKVYPGHKAQTDFSNLNFKNSHYLTAGGIMFREIGYEFYDHDPNYANSSIYKHDKIGLPAAGADVNALMGTNGPCAGCHVHSNPESHLFNPVVDSDSGSYLQSAGCAACHQGQYAMSMDKLNDEEEKFDASMDALREAAANRGYFWKSCNPYVFQAECDCDGDPDTPLPLCGSTIGTDIAPAQKNWCNVDLGETGPCLENGKNNMGALFNLNMLEHEPGAFTHNSLYSKRLIYDSLDWLDDRNINGSVDTTLPLLLSGTTLDQAMEFLLGEGGSRP